MKLNIKATLDYSLSINYHHHIYCQMFQRCYSALGGIIFLGWFPKEGRMFLGSVVQCACLSVLTDLVRTFQPKFLAGWKSPDTVLLQVN